jgi:hypothetical protein
MERGKEMKQFEVYFKAKGEWYFVKAFDSYADAVGCGVEAIYMNPSVEDARVQEVSK